MHLNTTRTYSHVHQGCQGHQTTIPGPGETQTSPVGSHFRAPASHKTLGSFLPIYLTDVPFCWDYLNWYPCFWRPLGYNKVIPSTTCDGRVQSDLFLFWMLGQTTWAWYPCLIDRPGGTEREQQDWKGLLWAQESSVSCLGPELLGTHGSYDLHLTWIKPLVSWGSACVRHSIVLATS